MQRASSAVCLLRSFPGNRLVPAHAGKPSPRGAGAVVHAHVCARRPPAQQCSAVCHAPPWELLACRINGPALPHLNFEWPVVPTEVNLGLIKDAIAKRHGGAMPGITLYKGTVSEHQGRKEGRRGECRCMHACMHARVHAGSLC